MSVQVGAEMPVSQIPRLQYPPATAVCLKCKARDTKTAVWTEVVDRG